MILNLVRNEAHTVLIGDQKHTCICCLSKEIKECRGDELKARYNLYKKLVGKKIFRPTYKLLKGEEIVLCEDCIKEALEELQKSE